MSAIITLLARQAAHVFTDGAGYDQNGKLLQFLTKAYPVPQARLVVSTRGHGIATAALGSLFGSMQSLDEARDRAIGTLEFAESHLGHVWQLSADRGAVQVVVAGLDSEGRPAAFTLANCDCGPDVPAWKVVPIEGLAVMPSTPQIAPEIMGLIDGKRSFDDITDADCVEIMEVVRRHRLPVIGRDDLAAVYAIGGFIQATSVSAEGISTRILRRWPDRIGERISPVAA